MTLDELPDAWRAENLPPPEVSTPDPVADDKRRRVGGTDLGPIVSFYRPELAVDLAKYANASDVWMRLVHSVQRPRTPMMQRGIDAEPRLRAAYLNAFGGTPEVHERPWVVPHHAYDWATVSPDDVVHAADGEAIYVEYKSTSVFARHKWGDAETDAVPDLYQLQVQHGLEILNLPLAHLFVGFGRDVKATATAPAQFLYEETRRYVIRRDPELAAMALAYAHKFKTEFVDGRKPPPIAPVHNKRKFAALAKPK